MKEMIDLTPDSVVLAEMTRAELVQSSGIHDEELNRDLTNFEAIVMIEKLVRPDVQVIWIDDSKHLTEEAFTHNQELVMGKTQGNYEHDKSFVAIVSQRPTDEQLAHREAITSTPAKRSHLPTHHQGSHGATHDHSFDRKHVAPKADLHR